MNVLVAAVSGATSISGVQRHALNLVRSLESSSRIDEVHVVIGPWQKGMQEQLEQTEGTKLHIHVGEIGQNSVSRNAWHYWMLPDLAERLLVEVLHLTYPVPVNRAALFAASVVTLHDLYPYQIPGNFGYPRVLLNRWMLGQCLRAVDGIACVSAYTAEQLTVYMKPAVVEKAVCIPNCVEVGGKIHEGAAPDAFIAEPFLLCVAQHRRNKNLLFALRVFEQLHRAHRLDERMGFAIVGMAGPETSAVRGLIGKLGLHGRVRLLEGLTDDQLAWCYAHCHAVVAPSVTEGFGLPVAEALGAGCRVVCSDIPAFREFAADHCRYVRLEGAGAEERFADAIVRSLVEPKPRAICFPELTPKAVGKEYTAWYEAVVRARHLRATDEKFEQAADEAAERQLL